MREFVSSVGGPGPDFKPADDLPASLTTLDVWSSPRYHGPKPKLGSTTGAYAMKQHLTTTLAACIALVTLSALPACGPSKDTSKDATPPAECDDYQFDCGDGNQCVDADQVCDGTEDCATGNDETDCGCGVGNWTCDDGQCIPAAFVCDGVFNCVADHSDEEDCPGP